MGATSWRYYTAYQPDAEAALQALRGEVFAREEYVDPTGPIEDLIRRTAQKFGHDPDSSEVRAEVDRSQQIARAIETGDSDGLARGDRSMVERVRAMKEFAEQLGAASMPTSSGKRPQSIDELLEMAAECGTHSILDIERVAPRIGFAVAAPMPPALLRRTLGTVEPSHDQVESQWADIAEGLGRWQAYYVEIYQDGRPHEYAFIGCSGD